MTKIIKDSYENFMKKADKGWKEIFSRKGTLGRIILYGNGGRGYRNFFENFKNDVNRKIKSGVVAFRPSTQITVRKPSIVRRSLMKRK
tara:strand:+ start:455 stop:718 length:264 start_codon:yes stop_codon:yes gene_type:complete